MSEHGHDTYVFQRGRRYEWNCPCGANSAHPFARRMDADDDAYLHERGDDAPSPPSPDPHTPKRGTP